MVGGRVRAAEAGSRGQTATHVAGPPSEPGFVTVPEKALYQRGQAYFRKGDLAKAKADLMTYMKWGPSNDFAKARAAKMLMDIAAKKK